MVVQKSDFIFKEVKKKNKDWLKNILMILYVQEINTFQRQQLNFNIVSAYL